MSSLAVIEYLDIPEYVPASFFPCCILLVVQHLAFNSAEKSFRTSVVIAITFSAHTANHSVFPEETLIIFAAVLYAPVGTMPNSV